MKKVLSWSNRYFRDVVHNCIVHPLMCFMPARLGTRMHDLNARWAYGDNRYDEIAIEESMKGNS